MCLLAQTVPKDSRSKFMPLAFGGIALGVLLGYPFGGLAYQFLGKPAPFLLIAFFISLNIGKCLLYCSVYQRMKMTENTNDLLLGKIIKLIHRMLLKTVRGKGVEEYIQNALKMVLHPT